ncbi:hypothetical protein [Desulfurobacterium thermolithotrophum]|uniref:hypothetical protein n=1 Tax=Desulfurobacterium thermolithotrophum TaxID=64160 RepID=UPI0009FF8C86|nr:hypothetical protein [Desulfurobacterium thermolithotrophum]
MSLSSTGKKAGALITEMNQPLGRYAGNALEVKESIDALSGDISKDLLEVTSSLVGALFELTGYGSFKDGKKRATEIILSGKAVERFIRWIEYLGGAPSVKVAEKKMEVRAPVSGYITHINGEQLGYLVIELGGGRRRALDKIDYSVGLRFFKKIGDYVEEGEPIGEIYYSRGNPEKFLEKFLSAYIISEKEKVTAPTLVKKKII